jgi:hypothetical protein
MHGFLIEVDAFSRISAEKIGDYLRTLLHNCVKPVLASRYSAALLYAI